MTRWIGYAVLGALTSLLAGLAACQLSRGPDGPRPSAQSVANAEAAAEAQAITERMERKRRLVEEMVAGRRTLLQTAAGFRDIGAEDNFTIRQAFPHTASDEEAYCRSILEYVRVVAPPDEAAGLCRDLEDELNGRLRDGTLALPER